MKLLIDWSVLKSEAVCNQLPEEEVLALHMFNGIRAVNEAFINAARKEIRRLALITVACIPASLLMGYVGVVKKEPRCMAVSVVAVISMIRNSRQIHSAIKINRDFSGRNNTIDRDMNQVIANSMADNLLLRQVIEEEAEIEYRDVPIPPTFIAENQ